MTTEPAPTPPTEEPRGLIADIKSLYENLPKSFNNEAGLRAALNQVAAEREHLRAAYERVVAERDEARQALQESNEDLAKSNQAGLEVTGLLHRADSEGRGWLEKYDKLVRDFQRITADNARLRSDLNQATAVVEAALAWRDQFAEPDAVKWPRRSGLIAAVDAYRAYRAAPTGGVEG